MVVIAIFVFGTAISIHNGTQVAYYYPDIELGNSFEIERAIENGPNSIEAHAVLGRMVALERMADTAIQQSGQKLILHAEGEIYYRVVIRWIGWPSSWCWYTERASVSSKSVSDRISDTIKSTPRVRGSTFTLYDKKFILSNGKTSLVFALIPIAFLGMTLTLLAIGCRNKWAPSWRVIVVGMLLLVSIAGILSFKTDQIDIRRSIPNYTHTISTTISRAQLRALTTDDKNVAVGLLAQLNEVLDKLPEDGASAITARFFTNTDQSNRTNLGWPLPVLSIDSEDLQDAVAEPGMLAFSEGALCMRLPSKAGASRITSARFELVSIAGNVVLIAMVYMLSGYFMGWFGYLRARRAGQLNTSCSECGYDLRGQLRPNENPSASSDQEET